MDRHEAFVTLMSGRGQVEPDEELLEDGVAFAGRREVPGPGQVRAAAVDGVQGRRRARREYSDGNSNAAQETA